MRKNREYGEIYHITATVNNGLMVFEKNPEAKQLFMVYLMRAKKKYGFVLINFCIMGNHVHLQIKTGEGVCISRVMQWLLGCFAQAWNRKKGTKGHFWNGRFWSRVIKSGEDLRSVFGYIAMNPVKAGEVDKPEDWEYCGIRHFKENTEGIIDSEEYRYLFEEY
jgi:REP element-mobilizing transposase RayT